MKREKALTVATEAATSICIEEFVNQYFAYNAQLVVRICGEMNGRDCASINDAMIVTLQWWCMLTNCNHLIYLCPAVGSEGLSDTTIRPSVCLSVSLSQSRL